jgi:hypothetical protein
MQAREAATHKQRLEKALLDVSDKLKDIDARRSMAESNLQAERQWRESLQKEMEADKRTLASVCNCMLIIVNHTAE